MRKSIASTLDRVGPPTQAALAVLATASGAYTYKGAAVLLSPDGMDWWTKSFALVFAMAVTAAIWVFWIYVFCFIPYLRSKLGRAALVAVVLLIGAPMIFAMSSWLNAIALFGTSAREQDLAGALVVYETVLDASDRRARAVLRLQPNLLTEAARFEDLAEAELKHGMLTGTPGKGAVVATLRQVAQRLRSLARVVEGALEASGSLVAAGQGRLAQMRAMVSGPDPIEERVARFSDLAVELDEVLARLGEESVVPAIRRTAENLQLGLVLPATSKRSADLAGTQIDVMRGVKEALGATGDFLAEAAREIEALPAVAAPRRQPLTAARAVLVHARDFVPSWAAAVSIDLMPLVLMLFLIVVVQAERREEAAGESEAGPGKATPMSSFG